MPEAAIVVRLLTIHGLVQGVGYRASAQAEGVRLGLSGWVRNRRSGAVEALIAGPRPNVEAFIAWAHRGPLMARVERVEVLAGEIPENNDFDVFPTL
ncbi:acylphosphatase [Azoarcus sp. KH32C]|uniref:acylphosphatase n=1 Tax=Azoarcus sp. KH32C TaxID=748247 RepID=UPI00023864AF|nr:acylphosphatase [Azoarcus sp. KH32C]BAL23615.1 acylphosphatase [Azoarcus sp. KH32C]